MFVDTATVLVQAGKGGDGAVSFRHEIYVDKGGPDGGDGGRGGDVIFTADSGLNTLVDFRYKPELKASNGQAGAKAKRAGRSGDDIEVKVPVGTVVTVGGKVIADFTQAGQRQIVAKGGDGGFGNAHFKSSTRQTPRIAELGEPGDAFEAQLELKLLADVGLVGFPNAGKSTFLSVVSNAKPEIANYEFTTLSPNLGVADFDSSSLLIADIPGLIEGASEGKGLGDAFLRHVERTAVLLHLIDIYSEDIADRYQAIRHELTAYSEELGERPEVIALTKAEGLDTEIIDMQRQAVQEVAGDAPIFVISSQAHQGVVEVLRELKKAVDTVQAEERTESPEPEEGAIPVITMKREETDLAWRVKKVSDEPLAFAVVGKKIEKFARRTDPDNYESLNRLRDIMKKMGITHELTRQGALPETRIRIGEQDFTLVEQ